MPVGDRRRCPAHAHTEAEHVGGGARAPAASQVVDPVSSLLRPGRHRPGTLGVSGVAAELRGSQVASLWWACPGRRGSPADHLDSHLRWQTQKTPPV